MRFDAFSVGIVCELRNKVGFRLEQHSEEIECCQVAKFTIEGDRAGNNVHEDRFREAFAFSGRLPPRDVCLLGA